MSLAKKSLTSPLHFPVVTNEGHADEVQVLFPLPRGPHGPRHGRTGQALPRSQRRILLTHLAVYADHVVPDLGVHRSDKAELAPRVRVLRVGAHGPEGAR